MNSKRWHKPVRAANDASVQGYGSVKGRGVELLLTLGTGLGSALFTDGRLCPGLELGHHPWKKKTYEDYLGRRGLDKYGKKRWNKLVMEAIAQTAQLFNWDHLYLGGGNTKRSTSSSRRTFPLSRIRMGSRVGWRCGGMNGIERKSPLD